MTAIEASVSNKSYHTHPYLPYLKLYPAFIILLSVKEIYNGIFSDFEYSPIIIAMCGLSGGVCYLINKPIYKKLIYIWAIGQAPVIILPILEWNAAQVFGNSVYLSLVLKSGGEIKLGLNVMGVLYICTNMYFNHLNYIFSLVGKNIILSPIKPMANLKDMNHMLPANGEIVKRVIIDKEDNWMFVQVTKMKAENLEQDYLAVRGTDKETFKPGANKLVRVLKLKDNSRISENKFVKEDFEYLGVAKGK